MALPKQMIALLFVILALGNIDLSACQQVVKGKVSCLDCPQQYDLSGIRVVVKCDKVKKTVMATTEEDGVFQVDLPQGNATNTTSPSSSPKKCDAKIFGGPNQIYATNKDMISQLVMSQDSKSYTVSTPLAFSTSCSGAKCGGQKDEFGASKPINLRVPPEWGLAPMSFYVPVFPIIGIP